MSAATQEMDVSPLLRDAVHQALDGPASACGWINAILADPAAPAAVREAVEEELARGRPRFPSAPMVGAAAARHKNRIRFQRRRDDRRGGAGIAP